MAKKMYVSFVLDETGSMMGVKEQTISGFNEYVDTLKNEANSDDVRFTLTKFNSDKVEIVCDGIKLSKVKHLNNSSYSPASLTPLYDAIGRTIHSLEKHLKEKKKAKGLVVIQTDGHENHSREFDRAGIFKLIDEKTKQGWPFAFLGADQDAWDASQKMGIPRGNPLSYASQDTSQAFQAAALSSVKYIKGEGLQLPDFLRSRIIEPSGKKDKEASDKKDEGASDKK